MYESARDALRELSGGQKLSSMKALKAEKERLLAMKNAQYEAYQAACKEQRELQTVCANVRQMLDLNQTRTATQERETDIS